MTQSLTRMLFLIAIVAISFGTERLAHAETPASVTTAEATADEDSGIVRVGHHVCTHEGCGHNTNCLEANGHACDGNCHGSYQDGSLGVCRSCRQRGRLCRVNGDCDLCRQAGPLRKVFSHFGKRCSCDVCRSGFHRDGYSDRHGVGTRVLPRGCGGKGCPLFGAYQMVYPVNPDHFDPRDGHVHAAQGYGVPMAVPLAPVVRHQYNYSWGVPASRITHISNHAPHRLQGEWGMVLPCSMPHPCCLRGRCLSHSFYVNISDKPLCV